MSDAAIGSEDTVSAPSEKPAHVTTKRESDPLVQPAGKHPASTSGDDDYGDLLPVDPAHYKVVREIARGGMGRILEVRDRRLGRNVAIKEVLHADAAGLARFEREVSITARLQHPAIVHVHEAGRWPDGKPFYVMKLIRGKPLDTRIAKAASLRERLELLPAVITVVDALAYAHSEQVIHRDLKPANVLVGDFGETIVIDWGIAKAFDDTYDPISIDPDRSAEKTETVAGAVLGTPSYMPPEQAAGERVDARADVYSLGAMLYQVLGGKPPFVGRTTAEVLAKVLDEQPPSLAEIDPEIPADLIAIVEKAMARAPADRFPTANEMAIELKRFQQGKLIESRQYTKWELAKRWAYRYRATLAAFGVALVAFAAAGVYAFKQIVDERDRADVKAREAMTGADRGKLAEARRLLDRDPSEALAVVKQLSPGSSEWVGARMVAEEAASLGTADVIVRGDGEVWQLAFSPDGRLLAEYSGTYFLRVWDRPTNTARIYASQALFGVGFDGNDTLVAVTWDGEVFHWDIATGRRTLVRRIPDVDQINGGQLSPDAKQFVAFGDRTRLIDLTSTSERPIDGRYSHGVWSPDGKHIYLAQRTGEPHLDRFDLVSGTIVEVAKGLAGAVASDGTRVWGTTWDGKLQRGILRDPDRNVTHHIDNNHIGRLAALPDGRVVAARLGAEAAFAGSFARGRKFGNATTIDDAEVATDKHEVLLFDATFAAPIELRGHRGPVSAFAVSPTGELASGDRRGDIRIWRIPPIRHAPITPHAALRVLLSPDRRYLAVSRRGPAFEVHDLETGALRQLASTDYETGAPTARSDMGFAITRTGRTGRPMISEKFIGPSEEILMLAAPPSGTRFATLDELNRVVVWDLADGTAFQVTDHADLIAISPDGSKLVTTAQSVVKVWDPVSRELLWSKDLGLTIQGVTVGARGSVAISIAGHVYVFDGDHAVEWPYPTRTTMRTLAFAPDGFRLFGAGQDGGIRSWNMATGEQQSLIGHAGTVVALVVSPDGSQLASSAGDNDVRVWNLATGKSTLCDGHEDLVPTLVFADNDTVVSSSLDRTARICDTRTGYSRGLHGAVSEVVFAARVGNRYITVDRFHQITEFPDSLPHDELLLRAWLDSATNLRK